MINNAEIAAVQAARKRNRIAALVADNHRTRLAEMVSHLPDDHPLRPLAEGLGVALNATLAALGGVTDRAALGVDARGAELIEQVGDAALIGHVIAVIPELRVENARAMATRQETRESYPWAIALRGLVEFLPNEGA